MATSLAFNEQFYLQQNPDVVAAIARGQFANAQQHFNQFGAFEGRNPNLFFDTAFYLSQYPDVLNARANPLEHFINFGAAEFRFANETGDTAIDTDGNNFANEFDSAAYLAANPDLANAVGAGRAFENAYEHFVLFGQFESRPGTPANGPFTNTGSAPGTGQNFTLTTAQGEVVNGTAGNDTFNATVGGLGIGTNAPTLNAFDQIDGRGGRDTLNLVVQDDVTTLAGGVSINGIEVVNLIQSGGLLQNGTGASVGTLAAGVFQGAEQIWQIENAGSISGLVEGQTAGFRDTSANVAVSYVAAADTASIALDNVVSGAIFDIAGTGLDVLSVSGSVAADGANAGSLTIDLTDVGGTSGVETVNLALSSATNLSIGGFQTVETLDASASTGGIIADISAVGGPDGPDIEIASIIGGSGADDLTIAMNNLRAEDLTIDGGAGADTITFTTTVQNANTTAVSLTLGAGKDVVIFDDLVNVADVDGDTFAGLITITDFSAGDDVLNLGYATAQTGNQGFSGVQNDINAAVQAASVESLVDALNAVANFGEGTYRFAYEGDTYVYTTDNNTFDNGDGLIRLVGNVDFDLNVNVTFGGAI